MEYGILSIAIPLLTIALAIITKDVIVSLMGGIFVGFLVLNSYNPTHIFVCWGKKGTKKNCVGLHKYIYRVYKFIRYTYIFLLQLTFRRTAQVSYVQMQQAF